MSTVPRSVRRQKHWGFPGAWMSLNSRVRNNFRFLMMKQFLRKNKCPLMKDERVTLTVTNGHTHLTHDPWTGTSRVPIRITGYSLFMWTHQHIHNHTLLLERPTLYTAKVEIKLYVKSGDIIKWQPQYRHDQITIFHIPLHELGFYSSKSILPCVQRIQDMDSIANDRGYSKWVGLTSPHYLSVTVTTVPRTILYVKKTLGPCLWYWQSQPHHCHPWGRSNNQACCMSRHRNPAPGLMDFLSLNTSITGTFSQELGPDDANMLKASFSTPSKLLQHSFHFFFLQYFHNSS